MNDLDSSSSLSHDLVRKMSHGLRTMHELEDRKDELNEIIMDLAAKLQMEASDVEKLMRLVCRSAP